MSGIYGFTCRNPMQHHCQEALDGLAYWNRIFGRAANGQRLMNDSGIGCHIEHFSDTFPYGGPILEYRGCPAVVDALIYNRDELFLTLGLPGSSLLSDEELLLKLIDQKGFDALAGVNGDFAGAIFDPDAKTWILFRDHFGVRPLYIYSDDTYFAFSTDIRGLLALPGADLGINETEFYAHFSGSNFLSQQRTDFARVSCALPAAVTTVKLTEHGFSSSERIYWQMRQKKIRFKSEAEYQQTLYDLIEDAVNRRCDAIPGLLGAELSGGFDSSVIDILISRHGRKGCFYSWSNDPADLPLRDGADERKVILDICAQEQIDCRFLQREDISNYRKKIDRLMPTFVNTIQISYGSAWLKSQGANVVFTGHAGDEGVSHRASRFELFCNHEYLSYFKLFWLDTKGKNLRLLRTLKYGLSEAIRIHREHRNSGGYNVNYYSVLDPEFRARIEGQFVNPEKYFNYAPHKYVMIGGSRPRMENAAYQGAVNGVRYLFPYVDYRVFDYALSIPRRLYINHTQNRVIFREAFRKIIPQSLYEVNYKDSASQRDLRKQSENSDVDSLKTFLQSFLKQVDRARWAGILDFNALEELVSMDKTDPRRVGLSGMFVGELSRCLAIQNLQENISKWREFDERHKETV